MDERDERDLDDEQIEALTRRTRAALDREVEALDADTQRRLRLARHAALETLEAPVRAGWMPVGAAAAVAVAAVGVALTLRGPAAGPVPARDGATEVELLLGEDDLALYAEDPEFYAWVEEQTVEAQAAPPGAEPRSDDAG